MYILLFSLTNLAAVIVVGTVWRLLGFDSFLEANVGSISMRSCILCPVWYGRFSLFALHLKNGWQREARVHVSLKNPSNREEDG